MFEKFSIPVWVHFPQNASGGIDASAVNFTLRHYIPSQVAITHATESITEPIQWGQPDDNMWGQPDDNMWGQPDENTWGQSDNKSQGTLGWDVSALGWGQAGGEQPVSDIPEACTDSSFPIPQPHSGQKRGEDWKTFFAWHHEENKKKEETEMPARWQSHQSHEHAAMNHGIPGRSSTVVVFEWQPNYEFGGFLECVCLTKAEVPTSWMSYNQSTSIPDGNWEEDNFPPASALAPSEPTVPPPPRPHYPVSYGTSKPTSFVSILHFHLGFRLAASTTTPRGRSTTFDDWTRKTQWAHLCKMVGNDPMNIVSIPEAQKHVITCFIGYLITLPQSQLSDIPPDLWDLGPNPSLLTSNAHI
ncbi:hypothetical protein BDR06DRAFT_1008662 [Suillus hirtellus]|nr:hypothetical protein BDR06DRAFT_1008662 [Suillus hirtellus]